MRICEGFALALFVFNNIFGTLIFMLNNIIKYALYYIVSYVRAAVSVFFVIPTFFIIIFSWTYFTISVGWVKYLSFIDSRFVTGNIELGTSDFMHMFGLFSLILFFVFEIFKLIGLKINITFYKYIIFISGLYIVETIIAVIRTDFNQDSPKLLFIFFNIFLYIMTIVSFSIWYGLGKLYEKIHLN